MRKAVLPAALLLLAGCGNARRDPQTVVFMIQSSPANLDPRIGTDEASEHINLWYLDCIILYNRRLTHVVPSPSGSYRFLETAALEGN